MEMTTIERLNLIEDEKIRDFFLGRIPPNKKDIKCKDLPQAIWSTMWNNKSSELYNLAKKWEIKLKCKGFTIRF